jgi:hypothetical protein
MDSFGMAYIGVAGSLSMGVRVEREILRLLKNERVMERWLR